jgi:tetratricopeptide (TPR) repeat protein
VSPRPAIFISAVSKELRSARQLVSNTLTFLGYEPEWQDIFSTEEGDLRGMLRRRIDACKAVVQVVGQCYGAEPPAPDEQFGRVSYTQYEALYARQQKRKVWYLILDEDFTTDPHDPESPELRDLQTAYRARLKSENVVRHSLGTRDALEANVLKLRDELTRLRRGVKQWALAVIVLLFLAVGVGFFHWRTTSTHLAAMDDKMNQLLRQATVQFPEAQNKVRQEQTEKADPAEVQKRTYAALAKQLNVDAKVLEEKLPQFAEQLKKDPNASAYERASAAYTAKDYTEAERLALVAADEAKTASKTSDAIKAFQLAGKSADTRIEYARAVEHFRAAAQLTDRSRDPMEWAAQQWNIAYVRYEQGQYAEAETAYRNVLAEYRRVRGEEDPAVMDLRSNLANALHSQGKYAEAETQHREVVKLREKVLGPEHADTLSSRNNLAITLRAQGKYAEAESQHREVLRLREKVLGPEHFDTLASRNNLAAALYNQGKYAEAETQHREVLRLLEKALGPEHPATLSSRSNLAVTLDAQGKPAEAEPQYREILKLREKVLGPEHPDTLRTRHNLASALDDQGKYAEGEAQYREVLKLREKVLGSEHPETIGSCFNLALCLKAQGKMGEARTFAQRAAESGVKVLGPNHPDALDYQKLWERLQKN